MKFFKQLQLLIWKNLSLRRRQKVSIIYGFLYDFLELLCSHFTLEEKAKKRQLDVFRAFGVPGLVEDLKNQRKWPVLARARENLE